MGGYNQIFEKMLQGVDVKLNVEFKEIKGQVEYDKLIYTGAIDEYYDYCLGNLEFRTVRFENEILDTDNFQGCAVVNYTEREIPYTRIIEHKHFEFGTQLKTVISREYPMEWKLGIEPYYPINDDKNSSLYIKYLELANKETNVYFGGRLGMYKYFDMDKTIEEALKMVDKLTNK